MDEIESKTCVRFRTGVRSKDFLNIYSGRYCLSHLGRVGGAQELSLNRKTCVHEGIVIHELLHALGFIHMHNRPNRDNYVKILWPNIDPRYHSEFKKVNPSSFNYHGTPYDLFSIMHYSAKAFSRNGGQTIVAKDPQIFGQRDGLSVGDIMRINNKYKCKSELLPKPEAQVLKEENYEEGRR
jgi:hypothetical protein